MRVIKSEVTSVAFTSKDFKRISGLLQDLTHPSGCERGRKYQSTPISQCAISNSLCGQRQ
jgi:hypothetical protein